MTLRSYQGPWPLCIHHMKACWSLQLSKSATLCCLAVALFKMNDRYIFPLDDSCHRYHRCHDNFNGLGSLPGPALYQQVLSCIQQAGIQDARVGSVGAGQSTIIFQGPKACVRCLDAASRYGAEPKQPVRCWARIHAGLIPRD